MEESRCTAGAEECKDAAGDQDAAWDEESLAGLAFACDTLSALFLREPSSEEGAAVVAALAQLDVDAAAAEWPLFGGREQDTATAREALAALRAGAADEVARRASPEGGVARTQTSDGRSYEHAALTPLLVAYRRLFQGPSKLMAPPWGSVYTDRDGVVFGLTTLDLRAWMRKNGVTMDTGEREPEDHIGLMLAQLSALARQRPELVDELLRLHLLTWSHHYLGQLREAALAPGDADEGDRVAGEFYRGLADLCDLTLEAAHSYRALQVETTRFYR